MYDGGRRESSSQLAPCSPDRGHTADPSLVSFVTEIITGWAHPLVQEAPRVDSPLVIIARRGSVDLQVPPLTGRRARPGLPFHPSPMPSPEHAHGEGELVITLESWEVTRASRRVEEGDLSFLTVEY